MDDERTRLRDLSARLLRLHAVLLERERHAYEASHGSVSPRELLQLLLGHERFAWLRALSQLIVRIDEAVDARNPETPLDADTLLRDTERLVRSPSEEVFATRYAAALQDSVDVVLAHAEVVKSLGVR